jgi:hypothetical protein
MDNEGAKRMPAHTVPKAHGKKTVTCILLDADGSIYTTGRDGYHRHFDITREDAINAVAGAAASVADMRDAADAADADASAVVVSATCLGKHRAPAKLDWIVRVVKQGPALVLLGFEKDDFVCVDTSTGVELCRISCGGGHRSWGFAAGRNGTLIDFVIFLDFFARA